mmetsp:Transcript_24888/g.49611  ORF Transcript_24888/g.49611 Transcript_24888/m.49611 type:complete len:83 (-) Transcript_24888:1197-1445(-)
MVRTEFGYQLQAKIHSAAQTIQETSSEGTRPLTLRTCITNISNNCDRRISRSTKEASRLSILNGSESSLMKSMSVYALRRMK